MPSADDQLGNAGFNAILDKAEAYRLLRRKPVRHRRPTGAEEAQADDRRYRSRLLALASSCMMQQIIKLHALFTA